MKKLILIPFLTLALIFAGCSDDDDNNNIVNPTPTGTSFIRVVHLSPDAPAVDVWVDGNRVLQNVSFKGSSSYLSVTNGEHRIQLSPAGATQPIVLDANVTLEDGMSYTAAAIGRLDEIQAMLVMDNRSTDNAQAKVRFIHTSPDAPNVDVAVAGGSVLFGNVPFGQAASYANVPANTYVLDVRLAGTQTVALRVPAVALGNGANYTIFAVGLAGDNSLEALPLVDAGSPSALPTSQLRVAHLSPDAPNVDVWVNRARVLENVPYEAISAYLTVPKGMHWVQVTPAGATSPVVIDAVISLGAGMPYTVAATGLLAQNDLQPMVIADNSSTSTTQAQVRFVHTSPDAPSVDVAVVNGPVLFSNVSFRAAGEYLSVNPGLYALEVRLAGTSTVALTVPGVELGAGANYSIFAIGLAGNGTLAALPAIDAGTPSALPMSYLRVAHLSPDAPNVDVWVNGSRTLENVPFQAVSGYLTVVSGQHRIQVTPAGASEPVVIDAVVALSPNMAYTVAATGLLGLGDLQPLILTDDLSANPTQSKIRFVHTSPDAPAVDVALANGGAVLFGNVPFRTAGDYLTVASQTYDLEVRLAGTLDVALPLPGVTLNANTNYTVFAVGLAGSGTLAALPVVDTAPMGQPIARSR